MNIYGRHYQLLQHIAAFEVVDLLATSFDTPFINTLNCFGKNCPKALHARDDKSESDYWLRKFSVKMYRSSCNDGCFRKKGRNCFNKRRVLSLNRSL